MSVEEPSLWKPRGRCPLSPPVNLALYIGLRRLVPRIVHCIRKCCLDIPTKVQLPTKYSVKSGSAAAVVLKICKPKFFFFENQREKLWSTHKHKPQTSISCCRQDSTAQFERFPLYKHVCEMDESQRVVCRYIRGAPGAAPFVTSPSFDEHRGEVIILAVSSE